MQVKRFAWLVVGFMLLVVLAGCEIQQHGLKDIPHAVQPAEGEIQQHGLEEMTLAVKAALGENNNVAVGFPYRVEITTFNNSKLVIPASKLYYAVMEVDEFTNRDEALCTEGLGDVLEWPAIRPYSLYTQAVEIVVPEVEGDYFLFVSGCAANGSVATNLYFRVISDDRG